MNSKKINNQEEIRYIKPKLNINEFIENQRLSRYYFQYKKLIRIIIWKKLDWALLLEKKGKMKNLTQNKKTKIPLKNKIEIYSQKDFF